MKTNHQEKLAALLQLSHELGREDWQMAILGEGNTSARLSADTFLVKASGSSLGTLSEEDVVECKISTLLPLLDQGNLSDEEIETALLAAMLMAEKTAAIWVGAAMLGGPKFLTPENVARIARRSDEHYRQRALNL